MKKLLILGAAFLALQAVPALAEEAAAPKTEKHHGSKMFEEQDTNKDGVVSEAEFLAFGKIKFAQMDADKDGKLTQEEAKAHRESMRSKWKEKHKQMKEGAADAPATAPAPAPAE